MPVDARAAQAARADRRRRRRQDRRGPRAARLRLGSSSPTPTAGRAACSTPSSRAKGVERIGGAHCYEFYAGAAAFAALQDEELGTFYLTDFLARQFDRLVIAGLGLDRHPELLPTYFGNYRRLVYLAQTDDPELTERARAAADRLGLAFERRSTGFGELAPSIHHAVAGAA